MRGDARRSLDALQRDHGLRARAIEIVAQLPESQDDALLILGYARELVVEFLPGRADDDGSRVVPLRQQPN